MTYQDCLYIVPIVRFEHVIKGLVLEHSGKEEGRRRYTGMWGKGVSMDGTDRCGNRVEERLGWGKDQKGVVTDYLSLLTSHLTLRSSGKITSLNTKAYTPYSLPLSLLLHTYLSTSLTSTQSTNL